ncbi:MAG TPA: hypothetical protein VM096_06565 [Vicinamibacterales bacterium]|nr:hypothetical protein [Vicinamibacterales bacterium]
MALWIVTVVALAVALMALMHSRHTARKLAEVTQLYWQLKFDHGELKAKVDPPAPRAAAPQQTFVPLSRLRQDSGEAGSQ